MRRLFGSASSVDQAANKTRMLFVFRDHSRPPLEELGRIVRADLDTLWSELDHPAGAALGDFFEFDFAALPHYEFARPAFDAAVDALRERVLGDALWPGGGEGSVPSLPLSLGVRCY